MAGPLLFILDASILNGLDSLTFVMPTLAFAAQKKSLFVHPKEWGVKVSLF
jgi:hypothetical protein